MFPIRPFMRFFLLFLPGFCLFTVLLFMALPISAVTINEFTVPTAKSEPIGIASGSDGNLWFTEFKGNKIGRITKTGAITEFTIPTANGTPNGIASGPDGALWFTEYNGLKIGRITTAGTITEFTYPPTGYYGPADIVSGPDGNLWFTENGANNIWRLTTAGTFTKFPIPTANSMPSGITHGSDGALWFTESAGNNIGRITKDGVMTEFPIPTANSFPTGIASGPDGALWFTEAIGKIGRITTAGIITEFPIPNLGPQGITSGPDGALWFTEGSSNNIGRITTDGVVTEFPVPTASSYPTGIASGPDGALWFIEEDGNKIGQLVLSVTETWTGTIGTEFTIEGSGFGDKKNKVLLGQTSLKILEWTDQTIQCTVPRALPVGSYDVTVEPHGTKPIVIPNAFAVAAPEIDTVNPTGGSAGDEITINGLFLGTKKGKVTLGAKTCRVLSWSMDPASGESDIQFVVPKGLGPGTQELKVTNGVGSDTIDFIIK